MERVLYDPPDRNLAVQWSEDNVIAVASGCTVGLVSPCHPEAPRAAIDCGPYSWHALDPKCRPENDKDPAYRLNFWRRLAPNLLQPDNRKSSKSPPLHFAWSPSGLGTLDHGGCLLSLITSTHQVSVKWISQTEGSQKVAAQYICWPLQICIYGETGSGKWQAQTDLSTQLSSFMDNCPLQARMHSACSASSVCSSSMTMM